MTELSPLPRSTSEPLRPHARLPEYYRDEAGRQDFVRQIFDATAPDYDRIESMLAFGSGPWYRRQALLRASLGPGMQVVDVGIGTGLLAREALSIIGASGQLTGVDPSPGMMGQIKLPDITLRSGRAEALPCEDHSADFISMGYALRHVADVDAALAEYLRVLRPGGKLLMLEITRPNSAWGRSLLKGYMRVVVPGLARWVSSARGGARDNARDGAGDTPRLWRYYWDTIDSCITPPQVLEAMQRAGFVSVRRHLELGLFSEYTASKAA